MFSLIDSKQIELMTSGLLNTSNVISTSTTPLESHPPVSPTPSTSSTSSTTNPSQLLILDDFSTSPLNYHMYENYKNLLYVYPHQINLPQQKFKNILLRMFLLSGENWKTDFHAALYKDGGIATALQSTVVFHEKIIPLYHEWKIALPYNITDDHYLLFYFYNLDAETWEKPYYENEENKSKSEPFQRIGFTWLPLLNEKSVLHSGKFELPIAMQNSQVKLGFSGLKPNTKTPTCQWLSKANFSISLKIQS